MASAGHKDSPVVFLLLVSTQQLLLQLVLLLLLCLLAFMIPFGTSSTSDHVMAGYVKSEREALLAFKSEIIYHDDHRISMWGKLTDDCCQWAGVSCDNNTGHVIQLDLNNRRTPDYTNNDDDDDDYHDDYYYFAWSDDWCDERQGLMSGNISSALAGLKHLRYLDLSCNSFSEITIPKFLGSLVNLVHLDLSNSNFIGVIHHELGNLTRLRDLFLGNLHYQQQTLHDDDAEWLSGLSSLRYLFMDNVELSGATNLMQSLNKLRHLEEVSLLDCGMKSIPESLPYLNFTSLTFMNIGYNMYDNTSIPQWLFRIHNLRFLNMYFCGWTGTIPSSVGNATSLQYLDLSVNSGISGEMPREFSDLCNLQWLKLDETFVGRSLEEFRDAFSGCIRRNLFYFSFASSSLKGPLPDWLGEFRNLTSLTLSSNAFYSSIPESLGRLSRLQHLDLASNSLNGSIPESLGRLSRLQYLNIGNNTLDRSIPESLSQLSNLVILDLRYNNFNYSYVITEAHLANLTSLKMLLLSDTNLVFNISPHWIPGFQAQRIYLSDCQVGPNFPVWLANQVHLVHLDISNTGIKDSTPDWFWNITYNMTFIDVSNNEITGKLPQRLKFHADRYHVEIILNSNRFEGSIPYFPPNVDALDLSNNSLSGVIPSDLGNFAGGEISPYLSFLSFSSNNLTGLQYLILANNSLESEVPASLTSSSMSLEVLHLSNNHLHGEFPSFLKKCSSLITLTLDHNNLSGNLPTWVGETMTSLMILNLKENNFSGSLPLLSDLTSLHFLDLSHNSFAGSIPQSYGNLTGMINATMNGGARFSRDIREVLIIKITVSTKGGALEYGVTLSSLRFIDLSANNLSGQIPKEIVNLVMLQNLNLSGNHLTGEIPRDIGAMQALESLDLSRNDLTGPIPLGLSTLDFLGSLNLAHNNLSGEIPYTGHLTTFNDPSVYDGNLNLCGAPLVKNCTSDHEPTTSDNQLVDDDDQDDDLVWFIFGLMPGLVVGFWTVCGILIFKQKWRHAFFRSMDYMYDMIYVKVVVTTSKLKRALVE